MWLFLNDAFLSIVADRHTRDSLLVRSRFNGDIERVFPDADVSVTPSPADYRYRATINRRDVADVIADDIEDIDYDNFKSSVPGSERHNLYLCVWNIMRAAQDTYTPKRRRKR